MAHKLYLRKNGSKDFNERLDICVDLEFSRNIWFEFRSQVPGICNVHGVVVFDNGEISGELTHSSGSVNRDMLTNLSAFSALLPRLEILANSRLNLTEDEILNDEKIQAILKLHHFEGYKG